MSYIFLGVGPTISGILIIEKKAPKMHLYLPIFEWMCYTNTWNVKIYCLKQETKLYTSLFNGIKMNALLEGKY